MRMIVDLSNLDGSMQNITIGESGQRLSSHYKDQWSAYYGGTSFPMQFNKMDGEADLDRESALVHSTAAISKRPSAWSL